MNFEVSNPIGAMRQKAKNTMEKSELIEIAIEDGTIVNLADATATTRISKVERWGAIVTKDLSQTGGLARKFLQSRDSGRILLIKGIDLAGATIEMAEKLDTYARGVARDYRYFLVEGAYADRLMVRQIKASEVPKGTLDTAKRDADPSASLLKVIDELRGQVNQLEEQVEAHEKQRAAAKNVANRIRRTLQKGITVDEVKTEIDQLVKSLKQLKTVDSEAADADEADLDAAESASA